MGYRRAAYAALLGGAVLFQIFFRFYLSTFTLALVLLLPVLSLLLSLPGALGASLALSPAAPTVVRGEEAVLRVKLARRVRLPLPRLRARLRWSNQLTGEGGVLRWSPGQSAPPALAAPHCGRLVCRVEGAWCCDLLGLFPLPIRAVGGAAVLVLPPPLEQAVPDALLDSLSGGAVLRPRPGGGPGEDYELRDYRAGDPLRSVHWKLSSKRDGLVVREVLEPQQAPLALTFDHLGPPEALDQTLARLYALSRALLERGRSHSIQWADPTGGGAEGRAVDCPEALLACLERICSTPAPAQGRSILDGPLRVPGLPGRPLHIHVTPAGLEGGAP